MDRKQIVNLFLVCLAILAAWFSLNKLMERLHPDWYAPEPQAQSVPEPPATTTVVSTTSPATGAPSTQLSSQPAPTAASQPATTQSVALRPKAAEGKGEPATIGYGDFDPEKKQDWPLGLTIDPRGAGLESAVLNRYRAEVDKDKPYVFQEPDPKAPQWAKSALAARSIAIDGGAWIDIGTVPWRLDGAPTAESASYSIELPPVLKVSKTYTLRKKEAEGEGFELDLNYSFASLDGLEHKVQLTFNGPNVPPVENSRDTPEVVVGYNEAQHVDFDHFTGAAYIPANPDRPEDSDKRIEDSKKRPILWAGITSAYFDCIVLGVNQDQIAGLRVFAAAKPDEFSGQQYLVLTFVSGELNVPGGAGQKLDMPLAVYLGPRQREMLGGDYFGKFPRGYDNTIVIKSKGFPGCICAACTWSWLIDGLFWMLDKFHVVLRDWGLAIMLLVLIVRLLLHPITKRSQVSMQKMTKMGPEIEKLKKKFGDDKEGLNRAMMDYYREHGFGRDQVLGCLPMFLQMPIWIALWSALQGTFELRHSSFLWGFTWIKDLAQQDRLIYFPNHFKFLFIHVDALNILPILLGVVFYIQQKMAPKPAAETPEQAQQRKMMSWMSLLFPVILYNGPAGLNLYIFASTAIGIWESKRVRDHIKAQEAAETAGKVIVDAKPTRGSRKLAREEQPQQRQGGCLGGWLADLQKKAEEMRDDAVKKKKPRR